MASADLLLHPVRLRIVQAFLGDRALTTGTLAAELTDVPPATLYRHVARLVDAGVLEVVHQEAVRGAVERTYVLRASAAKISADQIAAMSVDDMRQAFMAFVAGLLGDVDRYLARDDVDPIRDQVSFRLGGLWLDDDEFAALLGDLMRVFQPALANQPRPGRRRRIVATVLLPGDEADAARPGGEADEGPARAGGEADVGPTGADEGPEPTGRPNRESRKR
ncbi:helix-turn-helix domain-containing protein [Actinoplanes sp. NPDC051411]|uniref:helix-turn-helix domain-containing protein n=1 Tax=Actinoplanes sp. NPDC051411 TaxID=3155522 RepID=UPI00342D64FB